MLTAQSKVYLKQVWAVVLTVIFMFVFAMFWDFWNMNGIFFPWVGRWNLIAQLTVSVCGTVFIMIIGGLAIWRLKIGYRDLTVQR